MKKLLIAGLTLALVPAAMAQSPSKPLTGKRIAKMPGQTSAMPARCVVGKPGLKIINQGKRTWLPMMSLEWKTDDGQSKRQPLKRLVKPGGAIKIKLKHRAKQCKARVTMRRPAPSKPPVSTAPGKPGPALGLLAECRTGRGGIKLVNTGKLAWPAKPTVKWTTDNGQSGKFSTRGIVKPGGAVKARTKPAKTCRARVIAPEAGDSGSTGSSTKPAKTAQADCRTGRSGIKIVNTGTQVWTMGSKVSWKTDNGQRGQRALRRTIKPGDGVKLRLKTPAKKCKAAVRLR